MDETDDKFPTTEIQCEIMRKQDTNASNESESDIDTYCSDGSILSELLNEITLNSLHVQERSRQQDDRENHFTNQENTEVLYSRSDMDTVKTHFRRTMVFLKENDLIQARGCCIEAYNILNNSNDSHVQQQKLKGYSICLVVFQQVCYTINTGIQ